MLVVSTPSHLQETVYYYREKDSLTISNSLPFLLVETGQDLDANYHGYEADFCGVIYGEKKMPRETVIRDGGTIGFLRNCDCVISDDLEIQETSKSKHPKFRDYKSYRNYLAGILSAIRENSVSEERKFRYGMITTISQGYDATASAVLAYEVGCREALTMKTPAEDNGTEIAQQMGYENIYEVDKKSYIGNKGLIEAEISGSGDTGGMIYEAFENICAGKLIIMGDRGDSLWERNHDNVNDDLDFHSGNGFSQASLSPVEHLFRINSVVIRVPLIGGDSWSELARLSNSEELKPWSIGEKYDRPLARRIIEEKGIKRDSFGRKKHGAGVSFHFNTLSSLKSKMASYSYERLIKFKKQLKRKHISNLIYTSRYYWREFPIYGNYVLRKVGLKGRFKERNTGKLSSPVGNLLILWGVHEMKIRYIQ